MSILSPDPVCLDDPGRSELHLVPLRRDTGTLVQVSGELDLATAPDLPAFLHGLPPADCARVHLDLSGLRFLDAAGLESLARADAAVRGRSGRMTIGGLGPLARRLVEITSLPVTIDDLPPTARVD